MKTSVQIHPTHRSWHIRRGENTGSCLTGGGSEVHVLTGNWNLLWSACCLGAFWSSKCTHTKVVNAWKNGCLQFFEANWPDFRYQKQLGSANAWCSWEDILTFRELGLDAVSVILGAVDLQQQRFYLSISKLWEQLNICSGKSCGILIK